MKKAAAIFLINSKGKMLMQLRDNKISIDFPGHWGIIGGGVKENETVRESLIREIKEEINCNVEDINYLNKIFVPEINKLVFLFKGCINIPSNKINLKEGKKIEYFSLKELLGLKIPPFVKKFILENKSIIFSK